MAEAVDTMTLSIPTPERVGQSPSHMYDSLHKVASSIDQNQPLHFSSLLQVDQQSYANPTVAQRVVGYLGALQTVAQETQDNLQYAYLHDPSLKGNEASFLLRRTLDEMGKDSSVVDTLLSQSRWDIRFRNYQGLLILEVTANGKKLLHEMGIMNENVLALAVKSHQRDLPFIIVPQEGADRQQLLVHEIHHIVWDAYRAKKAGIDYYDLAKDEFLAYLLQQKQLHADQWTGQLVYDRLFTTVTVPPIVLQNVENLLDYALISQAISPPGNFIDDTSLVGIMESYHPESIQKVISMHIPTHLSFERLLEVFNYNVTSKLMILLDHRFAATERGLNNYVTNLYRLLEEKGISQDTLRPIFMTHGAKRLQKISEAQGWSLRDSAMKQDPTRVLDVKNSFLLWRKFVGTLGKDVGFDMFKTILQQS